MKYYAIALTVLISASTNAELRYIEQPDDFSNGTTKALEIRSQDSASTLFVVCQPDGELGIQFASSATIFPDDSSHHGMTVSITHKFDTSPAASTSNWFMHLAQYRNAWFMGDNRGMANLIATNNKLNIRLNRTGTVQKYELTGAAEHIAKITDSCQ